jgi:hypothetical protein
LAAGTRALFEEMRNTAVPLGNHVLAKEGELDEAFASGRIVGSLSEPAVYRDQQIRTTLAAPSQSTAGRDPGFNECDARSQLTRSSLRAAA